MPSVIADLFPAADPARDLSPMLTLAAKQLAPRLLAGESISRTALAQAMTDLFGATDATGAWSMRDAYDALEGAQVLVVSALARDGAFGSTAAKLQRVHEILTNIPTQSYRSEEQVARQQFSTPMPIACLAAAATHITASDTVLEPSAGTGMLAAWLVAADATLHLNEIDPKRAGILSELFNRPTTRHDAEFIHDLLEPAIRPSVILMNPPFSRSESRGDDAHAGARHLRSALLRLASYGRCVAIMPAWFSNARSGRDGYTAVSKIVPPRLDLLITGNAYAKHGTGVDVRVLVFDKSFAGPCEHHAIENIEQGLALVSSCARLSPPTATQPVRPSLPIRVAPRSGGLLGRAVAPRALEPQVLKTEDQTPTALAYTALSEPRPAEDPTGIYVPYRVARIAIEGAAPHPTPLVESIAMASILLPAPTYRPVLPPRARDALSDAQLETVIYAGQAFSRDLPGKFKPNEPGTLLMSHEDGRSYRQGFFLGDGTGAGKGRQVAAIILDQWTQGRRKALWVSKTTALLEDARRDWSALGGLPLDIQPLDAFPLGTTIAMNDGILFVTYATLRSQRHDAASRLQQILRWLGEDHEGMIVFDEAHAMANAAGTETKFGTQKGSEQGLAGVRLQNFLPRARVLYVSATGATDVANLCYASRLGLWGEGTAFPTRETFMSEMTDGGIAAMELVARDLKAQGLYTARALSFAGVEYDMLEHSLTAPQIEIYDAYADAWEIIHTNLEAALAATNIVDPIEGGALNSNAKSSALSRFESSKQRFFGQLLISMKLPTLIREIEKEVRDGNAVVIQLVTTAEAMLGRRLADLSAEERANLDIELSPREYVCDYLQNAFPTRMMQVFTDGEGNPRSEPMVDAEGRPVHCQEAIAARDALLERLCAMPAVGSALDEIIRHFGTKMVAEVTGRTRRLVWNDRDEQKLETRGAKTNLGETAAFMDGTKRILAFSDAGGTGRSYHADKDSKSASFRRIHFLLEPGWKAAEAIQGLGRSNRTNQATAPVFRPCTTNCRGERRFISTIARRLDRLGALTRGQRQTGGQNLFNPADNLESDYAREALIQWYHLLHGGKLKSISLDDFCRMTALKLTEKDSGALLDDLPPIQRWLNRLLALRIGVQDAIFDEYLGLIEKRIDAAREAGTLDVGVETIVAESMEVLAEHTLRVDPHTGAETKLVSLKLQQRKRTLSLQRLKDGWGTASEGECLLNGRSGKVAFKVPSYSFMEDDGSVVQTFELIRPVGNQRATADRLAESHWSTVDDTTFERLWTEEVDEALTQLDVETIHLATGLLLPVWNKLSGGSMRVWRVTDRTGASMLGRIIAAREVDNLAEQLGVDVSIDLSVAEIATAARTRSGIAPKALDGAKLALSVVNGQQRIEVKDFPPHRLGLWKSQGCFSEIVAFRTRLFVPVDRAEAVIAAMMGIDTVQQAA